MPGDGVSPYRTASVAGRSLRPGAPFQNPFGPKTRERHDKNGLLLALHNEEGAAGDAHVAAISFSAHQSETNETLLSRI
jgi:hypothetical protein